MPRSPQCNLAKNKGGQDATPSPVHACWAFAKNMDKQRVVYLFVCNDISYFLVETTVVVGSS